MDMLKRITIKGFKSIREMDIELRPLNILIGVNGAGKSNLISFFKMINEMMGGRLQQYIAVSGRAQSVLHFGPKVTPQMEASLEFEVDNGTDAYTMRLFHVAGDTLAFAEETASFLETGRRTPNVLNLESGHQETRIRDEAEKGNNTAKALRHLLNQCRVFHFHDTSPTARARQYCYICDDRFLMSDAGNLAAILYRLRDRETGPAYRRILSLVRRIAPFFEDFVLDPTGPGDKDIILNWRQKDSDQVFGPHQLSDGTLRAIALITLFQQPVEMLPNLIVVDEPELGLHPAAKTLIAGLIKKASHHCQVIVATQSVALLDAFDADEEAGNIADAVVMVERDAKESTFRRLDREQYKEWFEDYTVGHLWEKNVIGAGPFS